MRSCRPCSGEKNSDKRERTICVKFPVVLEPEAGVLKSDVFGQYRPELGIVRHFHHLIFYSVKMGFDYNVPR